MSYSIDTLLLHNQYKHDSHTGAVNVPIYNTSTFHQFDVDAFESMTIVDLEIQHVKLLKISLLY